MSTERRKAATINDIYRILGPDALLAYTDSVHDVVAFGSTCRESKQMFLNHKSLFCVFNTNLGILNRQFGFTSIKQLRAFLADSRACISGSFLLRALGVKFESYGDKWTDIDLYIYCRPDLLRELALIFAGHSEVVPAGFVEFHRVHNGLLALGYAKIGFDDTTYKDEFDMLVLRYARTDPDTGQFSMIEAIFVCKSTSSYIDGFDIDICGSRMGTLYHHSLGPDGTVRLTIEEDVIDFPNIKSILKMEARVHPNLMGLTNYFPGMWNYQFLSSEKSPGPYSQAFQLLHRIYKYYSRGFSFPEICLPPVWDRNCDEPDSWKPLVHSPPSAGFVFKSSMSELTDDKIYKTV